MAGHAFPFYRRAMAGRGVAAAAGVFLVVLPVEMAIAGALIVAGLVLRTTSLGTTTKGGVFRGKFDRQARTMTWEKQLAIDEEARRIKLAVCRNQPRTKYNLAESRR